MVRCQVQGSVEPFLKVLAIERSRAAQPGAVLRNSSSPITADGPVNGPSAGRVVASRVVAGRTARPGGGWAP